MVVKLCLDGKIVNIVSTYAPQPGCDEVEKVAFWEEMDQQFSEIPAEERVLRGCMVAGELERNDEGEGVVICAVSFDLDVVNTWFEKKENQYITYKSGAREGQINFLVCRSHLREHPLEAQQI
ncbi:uncharacterized protein [Macrobrachium rosenbergii]|uniref:uncharacterized protein n=1 Tax=Macrobrachium rosenbergii TaxID=79674 RepID=UPI0034D4E74D